jgi:pimeloyl-ACP methyl ester carboxylesterase
LLVLLHGFTATPRAWDLVRPLLEAEHEVLAPSLAGHLGGPPLPEDLVDGAERALDDAGIERAHMVGNSLGGYVALRLAERGRALSVVALAPAGGDPHQEETLDFFATTHGLVQHAAPHADRIASTEDGRRRATQYITVDYEHIPSDLVAHMIRGAAACDSLPLIDRARADGYPLDAARVTCPVRILWGTEDAILRWPDAARRYEKELPNADWAILDGVGHCPQLDRPLETAQLILDFIR